jgi:hypothetical protein
VSDPDGNPIPGIALQLGKSLVLTDSTAVAWVRTSKVLALSLEPEQNAAPGRFHALSLPDSVTPGAEDARPAEVVLQR